MKRTYILLSEVSEGEILLRQHKDSLEKLFVVSALLP